MPPQSLAVIQVAIVRVQDTALQSYGCLHQLSMQSVFLERLVALLHNLSTCTLCACIIFQMFVEHLLMLQCSDSACWACKDPLHKLTSC